MGPLLLSQIVGILQKADTEGMAVREVCNRHRVCEEDLPLLFSPPAQGSDDVELVERFKEIRKRKARWGYKRGTPS